MTETTTRERVATGLWRWLKATGLERFEMWRDGSGWVLRGTVLVVSGGSPFEVRYEVGCDSAWSTRSAAIDLREAGGERSPRLVAEIEVDDHGLVVDYGDVWQRVREAR